jgi:hypothetical protein
VPEIKDGRGIDLLKEFARFILVSTGVLPLFTVCRTIRLELIGHP